MSNRGKNEEFKKGQFQPGESGNPGGRPKGRFTIETDLLQALSKVIEVNVGGKPTKMTKQQALIEAAIGQSLKGSSKTFEMLLELYFRFETRDRLKKEAAAEAKKHWMDRLSDPQFIAVFEARARADPDFFKP